MNIEQARKWAAERSDMWLDLLRMYVGVGLLAKGISIEAAEQPLYLGGAAGVGWVRSVAAHYVVPVHIVGGLMLVTGMGTRAAAIANIPVLLGAVLFVHRRDGLFSTGQTLEFALLVLFMLCVFAISGSGRLSVDRYFFEQSPGGRESVRRPSLA